MSIRPAKAEEQRPGCRLEATKERPAEGSKPSAGHESRPQKRRIHQDPQTKNRQIDCAATEVLEFLDYGPLAAGGDFAVA
jgi:hypothetical protein